jgi:hypothetical protein
MKNYYQLFHRLLCLWPSARQKVVGGFLALAFTFVVNVTLAQERLVTGKVSDVKDNTALPGVNILLKGTTKVPLPMRMVNLN